MNKQDSQTRSFTVDARTLVTLGRESIKDHITAVLELVKNSYDADATVVYVKITHATTPTEIQIIDDGDGMTMEDLENHWLRIGFSGKRRSRTTTRNRRATGEKGIGRLSADRLGAALEIRTQAHQAEPVGLVVDWTKFDDAGVDLADIPVAVTVGRAPAAPPLAQRDTGTQLIISSLRQAWSRSDLLELYSELAVFLPPGQTIPNFRICLDVGHDDLDGPVSSSLDASAEVEVRCRHRPSGKIQYSVLTRDAKGSRKPAVSGVLRWEQWAQTSHDDAIDNVGPLGPVELHLLFYPRKSETVRGSELSLKDLRTFLDTHSGVRIYRDSIRVRPYGTPDEPEGDWLDLGGRKVRNPAGRSRADFRLSPNQLVGAVHISRDRNPGIADSSGREGLVDTPEFRRLKAFVLGAVFMLEKHYHEGAAKSDAESGSPTEKSPHRVAQQLREASSVLQRVKAAVEEGNERRVDRALAAALPELLSSIQRAEKSAEDWASQATVLRGMATVGISAAVFGHETQTSLSHVSGATKTAERLLKADPPRTRDALEELATAIAHANRVSAWGSFALSRVRRDKRKRKKTEVHRLVEGVLDALKPALTASNIRLDVDLVAVSGRVFAMDIESIVINLVTNAYSACLQSSGVRAIRVDLREEYRHSKRGIRLLVSDSGPGVAPEYSEKIWEPLFSTKVGRKGTASPGTGLGLSIVASILSEHDGERSIGTDGSLSGAQFIVWLPVR